jgi:cation-transporting ATPase E
VAELAVSEVVLDDVLVLRQGGQVVADAEVLVADHLEVDESLLTGESDPVVKEPGDELLSGSFVVAGSGRARVAKVGADAYATQLAEQARRFSLARSELRASMDRIITWVSWALVPTGAVLFWSQLRDPSHSVRRSLVSATGGVVAMVPEGLILLTSVAFAVGAIRLARRRTLVQDLPAIETLARVDVACLDKTGTITEGAMDVAEVIECGTGVEVEAALAALAWTDPNPNATQLAIQEHLPERPDGWDADATIPFSSARKWSASSFPGRGSFVLGAPEMVLPDGDPVLERAAAEAAEGRRVLLLAHSDRPLAGEELPQPLAASALVTIEDRIRADAAETLAYFADEGVTLKVISGDNPTTVGAVARRAGLPDADNLVDARKLPPVDDLEALATAVEATTVFGRVSPHQKRAMVGALQSHEHVVAMTGDGVNDVLALKDADVGIAMASGSDATRSVAQLVLLDSNFSGLPDVLLEGRRVINNLQRVASLFLTKTAYALIIALVTGISGLRYPFLPRHLTLVGTMVIGVPSFFLALAPNTERVKGQFFREVGIVSIPSGVVAAAATLAGYVVARHEVGLSVRQERTTAVLVLAGVSLLVVIRTARPFVMWKAVLVGAMGAGLLAAIVTPFGRDYFELDLPTAPMMWLVAALVAVSAWLLVVAAVGLRRWAPD